MEASKMGTMDVKKLVISVSLPMMVSMLVSAVYNIVDSMFVSRICQDALTAVSLAFPMQNLMIAFNVGTGTGMNAVISRHLGAKNFKDANRAATNGLFLSFVTYLVFLLLGLFVTPYFFKIQNVSQAVYQYGVDYLTIILGVSVFTFMELSFERILQATGRTLFTMTSQGIGAVMNMILDPIMIFGLFGFPALGVKGAAIATVTGQGIAMLIAFTFNKKMNHDVNISFKGFKVYGYIVRQIYQVAIPAITMSGIGSIMNFGFNQILLAFESTAAAFYGVYIKLSNFILMPIFGLNNGLTPILSYNYGAQKRKRIMDTIRFGIFFAICLMGFGLFIFECFPAQLLSLFDASPRMIEIGSVGLRIIALHFIVAGICIVLTATFQALNHSQYSLIMSILRQLAVLLPVAYVLSLSGNLNVIWWAYPISESVSLLLSIFFFIRIYNKEIKYIKE